ncbi:GNAT family N-acetyltransferase [Paracoccus sp. M683]|uniref:GNAT family N-acetyltransferase n=1 Tax=Paracoccus sp. M683 TaxID=2594268 RepID=UPI00117E1ABE|nr:GNAT family protein [Paracoccus sp. M683]TRW97692.1 GNAT family N-acetyltransferase [Paracoccus sp. M683]
MTAGSRPLGDALVAFVPPPAPGPGEIDGRFVRLERLDAARHAEDLFQANQGGDEVWDYLGYGPFAEVEPYRAWQAKMAQSADPLFYAIRDLTADAIRGIASYLRIDPENGVIEIGHIQLSPPLQRSAAASEALMLMIAWAFQAGYRRVEWKCNALNTPSRRAALRLGFTFEGVFRQHMITKGRNRDTAWFSIIDSEWPALDKVYQNWLAPQNFDADGQQRQSLSQMTAAALPGRKDG